MSMTDPSILQLLEKADCRYTLVIEVSKRARQLVDKMPPLIDAKDKTEEYLPKLISTLEKYFGEMKYCQQKTKKSKAVIKYLEKNGVTM